MDETTGINEQTVTMNIPLDDRNTPPIVQTIQPGTATQGVPPSYPQLSELDQLALRKAGVVIENQELSTQSTPPQPSAETRAGTEVHGQEAQEGEKVKDPNRNEKGQFVLGNTASIGNEGGAPCEFCSRKEDVMKKATAYIERCNKGVGGKATMPFIEELAIEVGVLDTTVVNWAQKKNDKNEPEHPEFLSAYLYVKMYQKLRLQQRALGRYNPTGALTLLKFNHGMLETEKKIIAGDKSEPLQIEIIEERPKPTDE